MIVRSINILRTFFREFLNVLLRPSQHPGEERHGDNGHSTLRVLKDWLTHELIPLPFRLRLDWPLDTQSSHVDNPCALSMSSSSAKREHQCRPSPRLWLPALPISEMQTDLPRLLERGRDFAPLV